MRLHRYLNEKKFYMSDMDEIIDILKRDCKQYIDDVANYYGDFLLSGRKANVFFEKKRVRKDRNPLDTPEEIHELMDEFFEGKFDIKFRSNSFFASFDRKYISEYGKPFIVFPIGKYKAISSTSIEDIYTAIEEYISDASKGEISYLKYHWDRVHIDDETKSEYLSGIEDILIDGNYQDIRKKRAYKNEVMVHCKEYYILFEDTIRSGMGRAGLLSKLMG